MSQYMEVSGSAYWVCGACGQAVGTGLLHQCPNQPVGTFSTSTSEVPVTPGEQRAFMAEVIRLLKQMELNQRQTWRK